MKTKKILAAATAMALIGGSLPYNAYLLPKSTVSAADEQADYGYDDSDDYDEYDEDYVKYDLNGITYHLYEDYAAAAAVDHMLSSAIIEKEVEGLPVTEIETRAFADNDSLLKVYIPHSVKFIGEAAFQYCRNLKSVSMSANLTEIAPYAFGGCKSLTEIEIPKGVEKIWSATFYGCESLLEVKLNEGLKDIGMSAFGSCSVLREVEIPESVDFIEAYAFAECPNLRNVTILNPYCDIADEAETICSSIHVAALKPNMGTSYDGTITGYSGSTAQAYAEKFGYEFLQLDSPVYGDANGDKRVDASDASRVLTEYSMASTGQEHYLTPSQRKACDVNGDGYVDARDASKILGFYAYLSTGGFIGDIKEWMNL